MELKTVKRIHGVIAPDKFSSVMSGALVITDSGDSIVSELDEEGWILFDIQMFIENSVLFDVLYFAREDEEKKTNNLSILSGFDDDVSDLLSGMND